MAKRRILLTSAQYSEIEGKITKLETQLGHANRRVEELEEGLMRIKALAGGADTGGLEVLDAIGSQVELTFNPPVKYNENQQLSDLADELD